MNWLRKLALAPATKNAAAPMRVDDVRTLRDAERLLRQRGLSKAEAVALVARIKRAPVSA